MALVIDDAAWEREPPSGRLHVCGACGKQETWGETWIWYGSYKDIDDSVPIFKACTEACMLRREDVLAQRRIEIDIDAARSEEERLEAELARKRQWRQAAEARAAAVQPVTEG